MSESRKLTADELYPHLYKDYKRARQSIGELESFIEELQYENRQLKLKLNTLKNESENTPAKKI